MRKKYDAIVVGAGFYGLFLARTLGRLGYTVAILEREKEALKRASSSNQARVHNGYHYPRSLLTGRRSRISYKKFCQEFNDCIFDQFEQYYAISELNSKVSGPQFKRFCDTIEAPIEKPPTHIKKLFNSRLISDVYKTTESAFDVNRLKKRMLEDIDIPSVSIYFSQSVAQITKQQQIYLVTTQSDISNSLELESSRVFNCTYSGLNTIHKVAQLPQTPLKHELTEICLYNPPDKLHNIGITIMCGSFFSTMPFPSTRHYSLSHVRYTPHCELDDQSKQFSSTYKNLPQLQPKSNWQYMIRDAARYIPFLESAEYKSSFWEVKTVLPKSDLNDSRPILVLKDYGGATGFTSIVGGKIDNVYDAIAELNLDTQRG